MIQELTHLIIYVAKTPYGKKAVQVRNASDAK